MLPGGIEHTPTAQPDFIHELSALRTTTPEVLVQVFSIDNNTHRAYTRNQTFKNNRRRNINESANSLGVPEKMEENSCTKSHDLNSRMIERTLLLVCCGTTVPDQADACPRPK
jgi:hypothetical protein